jgi:hypothetical protein
MVTGQANGLKGGQFGGSRLFEAAARCASFKRAAQELKLTPGALSHGIDCQHVLEPCR